MSNSLDNQDDRLTMKAEGVDFVMIKVYPGEFFMGADKEEMFCSWERPKHKVTLTRPFYIGQTVVTQELYQAVTGNNPSYSKGKNLPVEGLSYHDAKYLCAILTILTKRRFELPTEAQWEYAARGGHLAPLVQTLYSGSNNIDEVAWYDDNYKGSLHAVAEKKPNNLGLYDMTGNVWEWCLDLWRKYEESSIIDPFGDGRYAKHVSRGGCIFSKAEHCRIAYRSGSDVTSAAGPVGVRLVMY